MPDISNDPSVPEAAGTSGSHAPGGQGGPEGSAVPNGADAAPAQPAPKPQRRGHRGTDIRDAVAEMTARAHEISQDAGNKMGGALRDVINAAAGLAGFAVESARDLVQYMVRRGQMSPEEGEKLIREAEEAARKRNPPQPRQPPAPPVGSPTS